MSSVVSRVETSPSIGIATPCNRVCVVDPGLRLCIGCGRTVDEIARWTAFDDAARAAIMAQLPARLAGRGGESAAVRA